MRSNKRFSLRGVGGAPLVAVGSRARRTDGHPDGRARRLGPAGALGRGAGGAETALGGRRLPTRAAAEGPRVGGGARPRVRFPLLSEERNQW